LAYLIPALKGRAKLRSTLRVALLLSAPKAVAFWIPSLALGVLIR